MDFQKLDIWDMVLSLLNNSDRFQSADLAEKGVMLIFQILMWDVKRIDQNDEVRFLLFYIKLWHY